ncbi:uncharacterized mitochondrial protein AtMg00810-like [Gossypium arboreum]|uniref:uncharacterized mitochondrial protein AtMg00810-like n=1 Tax=Gossypium arboreum TaxID=29729 RepID=UPI0022F17DBF|nr:uncharacterized mitochondrial protein AtMg00810-like [Gossypium arboreum]
MVLTLWRHLLQWLGLTQSSFFLPWLHAKQMEDSPIGCQVTFRMVFERRNLHRATDGFKVPGEENKRIEAINDFKTQMKEMFDMSDLGAMTYFLGMEVNQSNRGIFINQQAFALKILDKFCMSNCKLVNTPIAQGEKLTSFGNQERVDEKEYRSLVGCLLYLTATRPDLMHAAAKRVLRYVKGTLKLGVMFKKENELKLMGYSDSDWAGSADDMRSTSGYFFTLGSGAFCWSSKKQQTVAQSTVKRVYCGRRR